MTEFEQRARHLQAPDAPLPDRAELDTLMGWVLTRLELLSHGKTLTLAADPVTGGHDNARAPTPDHEPYPHLAFARRYAGCMSDRSRLIVLREAFQEWRRHAQGQQARDPAWGSFQWKRMLANSDEKVTDLARKHNVSRTMIYDYRRLYRWDEAA